jgi:hypothetical protein
MFWSIEAPFAPEAAFGEMMAGWREENERREQWCQGLFERQHHSRIYRMKSRCVSRGQ